MLLNCDGGLQHLLPVVHQDLQVCGKQRRTTGLHGEVLNWCLIWKPLESLMVLPRVGGERAHICNAVVFRVWAYCQPVTYQNLCCLVLAISVACLFCMCTSRWITSLYQTTGKLTREIFSWRQDWGRGNRSNRYNSDEIHSIFFLFILDMLPRKLLAPRLAIWEADTGKIWRKIRRGRKNFLQYVSPQIFIRCLILAFLQGFVFRNIFSSLEVLHKPESPHLFS